MSKFSSLGSLASALAPFAAGGAFFFGAGLIVAPAQQVYLSGPPPPSPVYYPEAPAQPPAADPLDQLLAPVALYPDPLISLILPAAAFPSDVAAAGAYLSQGGDPAQVDSQPWDPSVRSLAHYPEVVTWMAQNGPWTQTVGAAFVGQPAAVMDAIQRLRALAQAAGTLTDTPQQQVVLDGNYVEIEPAQPDVIYVPHYDPAVVFVDQPYYGYHGPFFTYGPAYGAGAWLTFGCNWGGGGVVIVGANYWHGNGGWWHPPGPGRVEFGASVGVRPWGFPANRTAPRAPAGWQGRAQIVSPRVIGGAPAQPPRSAFRNIRTRGPAAVAVVARNPGAFKGAPINRAIMTRSSGPTAPRAEAPARPAAARPPSYAAAPASHEERTNAEHMTTPANSRGSERAAPKGPTKAKPKPKPKPKPEKPKDDGHSH